MTETPSETPEPTEAETVARLAAEAALRNLPDHGPRIDALETAVQEILAALTAAAGPEGNAAKLRAEIDAHQQQQQQQIEDLRNTFTNALERIRP